MNQLRRRSPKLTYANVVATLALFVALGGVSYAATQLPKNSVGSEQLKEGSVSTKKLSNRVRYHLNKRGSNKDGAAGKDGIAGKDGAPGRDGAAGRDGAVGPTGATGPSHVYTSNIYTPVPGPPPASVVAATIDVPAGTYYLDAVLNVHNGFLTDETVDCELKKGSSHIDGWAMVIPAGPDSHAGLTLSGTSVVSAPTTMHVDCFTYGTSVNVRGRLTVQAVGAVN